MTLRALTISVSGEVAPLKGKLFYLGYTYKLYGFFFVQKL